MHKIYVCVHIQNKSWPITTHYHISRFSLGRKHENENYFFHRLKSSNKSILLENLSHSLSNSFCILRIKKINKTETYFFLHTDMAK